MTNAESELRGWETAAEAGDVQAMTFLGSRLIRIDTAAARRWFERAADAGDTRAMVNLGWMLAVVEPSTAEHWCERAAALGDRTAMYNLGCLIANRDPSTARSHFEEASRLGHAAASHRAAVMALRSDPIKARRLFNLAIAQGDSQAVRALRLWHILGPLYPRIVSGFVRVQPRLVANWEAITHLSPDGKRFDVRPRKRRFRQRWCVEVTGAHLLDRYRVVVDDLDSHETAQAEADRIAADIREGRWPS